MKLKDNIKVIQDLIDKLQIKFDKAIKEGDFLQSQKIDNLIYLLNGAIETLKKGGKKCNS